MKYTDFVSAVEEGIKERLEGGASAAVNKVLKNNAKWKYGITIRYPGQKTAPIVYLEEYYQLFLNGRSMETVLDDIIRFCRSVTPEKKSEFQDILSYEKTKRKIVPKLINKIQNRELLQGIPYMDWMDLAIVFYVLLDVTAAGTVAMPIQNQQIKDWNIQTEELYKIAMKNAAYLLPAELVPIREVIYELTEQGKQRNSNLLQSGVCKQRDSMYVLTNKIRSFGAVCAAYPHLAGIIAELLKESYYVLPSSIHEMIVVPKSCSIGVEAFREMICEINMTQVEEEEVLSNHAYYYDKDNGEFIF